MWLWLTFGSWALADECPQTNLHADGLNVYSIVLHEQTLTLYFSTQESTSFQQASEQLRSLFQVCNANETLRHLDALEAEQQSLRNLGIQRDQQTIFTKWTLRQRILEQEQQTALAYARMLESLERETGIAVLWNVQESPRVRGMISTARGSERIVDYIEIMYPLK